LESIKGIGRGSQATNDPLFFKLRHAAERQDHVKVLKDGLGVDVQVVDLDISFRGSPGDLPGCRIPPGRFLFLSFYVKRSITLEADPGTGDEGNGGLFQGRGQRRPRNMARELLVGNERSNPGCKAQRKKVKTVNPIFGRVHTLFLLCFVSPRSWRSLRCGFLTLSLKH
jgi:hypothetical protein